MPSEKQYLFLIRRLATGDFWTQNVPFVWQRVNRLLYIKHSVTAENAIHIQQNVICEHQQVCLWAKYRRAKTALYHQATLSGAVLLPTTWLANCSTKGEFVGYVYVFSITSSNDQMKLIWMRLHREIATVLRKTSLFVSVDQLQTGWSW